MVPHPVLANVLFDPSIPQNMWKTLPFASVLFFSAHLDFFLLTFFFSESFSFRTLLPAVAAFVHKLEVWLDHFMSPHQMHNLAESAIGCPSIAPVCACFFYSFPIMYKHSSCSGCIETHMWQDLGMGITCLDCNLGFGEHYWHYWICCSVWSVGVARVVGTIWEIVSWSFWKVSMGSNKPMRSIQCRFTVELPLTLGNNPCWKRKLSDQGFRMGLDERFTQLHYVADLLSWLVVAKSWQKLVRMLEQ